MTKTSTIFFSSDNNYAPYLAVALVSICMNTDKFCYFYVLDGGISEKNKEKIFLSLNKFTNFSLKFVSVDYKLCKDFKVTNYLNVAAYFRIFIADLFPEIDKVLYLDVDIIVQNDISELYTFEIDGYVLGACIDQGNKSYIYNLKENIEIDVLSPYFNSGVLLIDLCKWREQNITNKLLQLEKEYREKLLTCDQDLLNKCFENNYKVLPNKFNSMLTSNNAVIRHYYTKNKPWLFHPDLCNGEYADYYLFWDYAKHSVFYDELIERCQYKTMHQMRILKLYKPKNNTIFNPKVSVIVPVYNIEKYLRKCLDSLVYQSLKDIEIICINDASTDGSMAILQEYAQFDSRISVINFEKNKGVSAARNAGLELASGEYVGFVDSDDWLDLDFYEVLYSKAKEYNLDIVKGNIVVEGNRNNSNSYDYFPPNIKNKFELRGQWVTCLYRHTIIAENKLCFLSQYSLGEDLIFLTNFLFYVRNFSSEKNVCYHYVRHENSLDQENLSAEKFKNAIESICCLLDLVNKNFNLLSKEDYLSCYYYHLSRFLVYFYKTDSQDLKLLVIQKLCFYFSKSLLSDEAGNYFIFPLILQEIMDCDIKAAEQKINVFSSFIDFRNKNLAVMLSSKIKKEKKHGFSK